MKRVLVILALLAMSSAARADTDYDPYSQGWQGLGAFVGLAEGMGFEVDSRVSLDWNEISATDILVIVFPLQRVDPAKVGAFVNAGGNLLMADDFGEAKDAFTALGVLRSETTSIRATRYQNDQLWAPIANARGDHAIANDVGDVVTNHPAVFSRADGTTTVVAFEQGSVVVVGERGSGKFIAVSDPSILINRMLQSFPGNVQLAANMLRWLDRNSKARRVVLVRGDFGQFGEPRAFIDDSKASEVGRGVAELNFWLSERRAWLLTPTAMKVLAATLAILLLVLAMLALPVRRGPKIDGGWLKFARLIPGNPLHLEAEALLRRALGGLRLELRFAVKEPEGVLIGHQVMGASRLQQRFEVADTAQRQTGPRRRNGLDSAGHGIAPRRQEPRQRLGQIGPADGERTQWVHQPAGNFQQHFGMYRWRNLGKGDAPGIAEGTAFAGRQAVDHRHLKAPALQECRRGHADDAGTNDGCGSLAHERFSKDLKCSMQWVSKADTRRVLRICRRLANAMTPRSTSSAMGRTASVSPA